MEEAEEKPMDTVASFKTGKSLTITGTQYNVCSNELMTHLLVSSNQHGYIFYGTESDGLVIISSKHIDRESHHLSLSTETDDDGNDENTNVDNNSIIHRSYLPGQSTNPNSSLIPYWLSLNADETILAIILLRDDTDTSLIIFYDVVKLIQIPDSTPLCPPTEITSGRIQSFAWNPTNPKLFAFIDAYGSVSTYVVDQQMIFVGKCDANDDNSSICWSLKGKQIAVAQYTGALELYEPSMQLKKKYPPPAINAPLSPCISVLWLATHQFLLGFSDNSPDDNGNEQTFYHLLITYHKDQAPKIQCYYDLFFDALDASVDISSQYHYARLNDNKTIICGLSKSLKITVLGRDELNQDSLDIWSFADESRAFVKGATKVDKERPILTGMAIGLNSTLSISERGKKLPPCPMLLLSNSAGVLQVFYFYHQNLPSLCRAPDVIKSIQVSNVPATPSLSTFTPFQSSSSAQPSANGFSMSNFGFTSTPAPVMVPQPKEKSANTVLSSSQQPVQATNGSTMDDLSKAMTTTAFNKPTPTQQPPIKSTISSEQSSAPPVDNKKLLQLVNEFQTKLKTLGKPLPNSTDSPMDLDPSIDKLKTTLKDMIASLQESMQRVRTITKEHIETTTKIEDARHQIKISQKENLYHLLKDRPLDPWTQSRLDSIETKYDQLKHSLDVLLQLTRTTIRNKSSTTTNDESENEDFLPELEISLDANETMKHRIQKRICELSHQVSETEKDLQNICSKFNTDLLSSKTLDKTTMSSDRPFHSSDAQILSHLQATHRNILQVRAPSAAVINLSSTIEPKKQSTMEASKAITPSFLPSTPKQPDSLAVDSEEFKNMLRIVRTSIDLFSGATSPDQLQELSSTIATSPLSSGQKSATTSMNKTPTIHKTTNPTKSSTSSTATSTKASNVPNVLHTPAKSVASPLPTISVTPATPATQPIILNAPVQLQQTKPSVPTTPDLSRSQTIPTSGDSAIRSLLNNTTSFPTNIPSASTQPITTPMLNPVAAPLSFGNPPPLSQSASPTATSLVSTQSPFTFTSISSTKTTSAQPTSPIAKSLIPTGTSSFGSRPALGSSPLNLTTTSPTTPFGSAATATTTASTGSFFGSAPVTTASTPAPFSSPFGTLSPIATTSTTSTSPFGSTTSTASGPFTAANTTVTTSAPTTGIFGTPTASTTGPFGAPTASIASTGVFGAATINSTAGGFGTAPTTSAATMGPFGGFGPKVSATPAFGGVFSSPTSTPSTSPFGSGFAAPPSPSTGSIFGGFGSTSTAPTSTASTGTSGTSVFGSSVTTAPSTGASGFGASPAFGSNFSGFGAQARTSGPSTGFSFGGFASQPADAPATQQTFASFGSPTTPQQPSPLGGSLFGGAPAQSTGFNPATSPFGAPSTQSAASPSFTAYRK